MTQQQDIFFNEACLSSPGVANCSDEKAAGWLKDLAQLLQIMSKRRRLNRLRIHPSVKNTVMGTHPFAKLLNSKESPLEETLRQFLASRIESSPYLDETRIREDRELFEWEGRWYEFRFVPFDVQVYGLGAAFLHDLWSVSMLTTLDYWDRSSVQISHCSFSEKENAEDEISATCDVKHAARFEHLGIPARVYELTDKHDTGGWGTPMDLNNDQAQSLLDTAVEVEGGKALYNYSKETERVYKFFPSERSDQTEHYHGFPIPGSKAGKQVLRVLERDNIISAAEKGRLQRQSELG